MGDMAEATYNGLFCESCGQVIDGTEPGFSRKCKECNPNLSNKKQRNKDKGSQYIEVTLDQFHETLKAKKGWYICKDNAHEIIFGWRPQSIPNIEIKVATTINKSNSTRARDYGKDAIRVWAIWSPENNKNVYGLVKSSTIKRTKGWQNRLQTKVVSVLEQAKKNSFVTRSK